MAWNQQAPFAMPPGINLNAPTIRMDGGRRNQDGGMGRNNRAGLGSNSDPQQQRNLDRQRQEVRENMMAMQPPTREEVARTIFVGGLGSGMPNDDGLEAVLRCAGKLRRWTRAKDADDKKCKFGFAEYEDVESLEAAAEIYKDIQVPLFNADGSVQKEDDDGEAKTSTLLVVVDDQSREYIDQWKARKKEDDSARQFRIDGCKEDLRQCLSGLTNDASYGMNGINGDADGDVTMGENGEAKDNAEVVTIPLSIDDELADIPAEMRATVAEEIKAFRDRSNRRDIERLRREEELEQEDSRRTGAAPRASRLASPPPGGPASSANGIPVGPRGQQGVQGAPSGPKGFRGAQIPNDYVNGVAFVPGAGSNGQGVTVSLNREDEDAEDSDEELERKRQEKKDTDLEKLYQDQVRRWQNRERTRGAAQERERKREDDSRRATEKAKEDILVRLANWNDDEESDKAKNLYYRDRSAWLRQRERDREHERRDDDQDRKAEDREKADERRRTNEARGMADDFLGSMGMEPEPREAQAPGPAPFKISLGGAAKTKQAQAPAQPKRAMNDVEGLLEDEEDAAAAGMKRPELKPLQDTSTVPTSGQDLSDDEKAAARQQLASEIPTDTDGLFAHPIKWNSLSASVKEAQIRPFVERKIVEYLGVQEDLLVDTVMDGIADGGSRDAKALIEELEGPLEDEAEVLIKKVWRLLVFWGECESRGLS